MKRQTAIKSPTKHPRWNETFEFPVHVAEHQELVSEGAAPGNCGTRLLQGRTRAALCGVMSCAAASQCRHTLYSTCAHP